MWNPLRKAPSPSPPSFIPPADPAPARLVSLDAFRGFIMMMLAASGFGIHDLARVPADSPTWDYLARISPRLTHENLQKIGFHFDHPEWGSRVGLFGVSFWDLIQPAFMFMVGMAMPFSYARRTREGQSHVIRALHALWRAILLVLLGVFLYSQNEPSTHWRFTNVLAQIGLGYFFCYLLLGRKTSLQLACLAAILVGYWYFFYRYTPPTDYDYAAVQSTPATRYEGKFAPWSKNANAAHDFDLDFLNRFPRPRDEKFKFEPGGYQTLNFIPSIATMLIGILAGQFVLRRPPALTAVLGFFGGGACCIFLGVLADQSVCPIVKRIWTPSWALFSGGWVLWMLAAFHFIFEVLPLRKLAFPLVAIGANSILMYMFGQLMRGWTWQQIKTHFGSPLKRLLTPEGFTALEPVLKPTLAFLVIFAVALTLYRKRIFVRI